MKARLFTHGEPKKLAAYATEETRKASDTKDAAHVRPSFDRLDHSEALALLFR